MSDSTRDRVRRGTRILAAIVRELRAEKVTFMAGSIAYHAFVSLLPFLLLFLLVLTRVGGEALARETLAAVAGYLTGQNVDVLVRAAQSATENAGLSLVSLALLVWGTLRIFRGLDTAFSDIYESSANNGFLDQLRDGIVVFLAIGIALAVVAAGEALIGLPSLGLFSPVVTVLVVALALFPMYYIFPDENVSAREVVPGTVVAALGWTLLGTGFSHYAAVSSKTEYGVVGVIILLVTWLYFTGLVLLVGAAVNAVLAGRSDDVGDLSWGGMDPARNDAEFVAPLRELESALDAHEGESVTILVGDESVTVPAPDDGRVSIRTVERPSIMGGNRESGELVLQWDSWE